MLITSHSLHYPLARQQAMKMRVWSLHFQRKPREYKRYLIQHPWELPMVAVNLAAIEIQRSIRGVLSRSDPRGYLKFCRQAENRARQAPYNHISETANYMIYHVAALQIQRAFRASYEARYKYSLSIHQVRGSIELQRAARCMQRLWRRYKDRVEYLSRVQILRFRNNQDPAVLLRSINPGEAQLFDKATRIVLRFRLGGHEFPPKIYYKVFTQAPLCDVGSFAPRDYTRRHMKQPREVHNHPVRTDKFSTVVLQDIRVGRARFGVELSEESKLELAERDSPDPESLGWYARHENNGWRPVTKAKLEEINSDPVTKFTRTQRVPYHFNKAKRRENKEATMKRRRREWMMKLYGGKLDPAEIDARLESKFSEGVSKLHESKSNDLAFPFEKEAKTKDDHDSVSDVDELLEWTRMLDFDDYVRDWHSHASSFDPSIEL